MTALLLSTGVLVALVLYPVWLMGRDSRRRAKILAFATQRGWTYTPIAPELVDRWVGFPFGRGEQRTVTAVVRGDINGSFFTAFEYSYISAGGRNRLASLATSPFSPLWVGALSGSSTRYRTLWTVVVVALPTYLPRLTVVPESMVDRAGITLGLNHDLDLESEDFNRRYRVEAPNPGNASAVLTPRTMEILLARPAFAFRTEGASLVSWSSGGMDPMDVLRRASTLDAVSDGVPGYLWADNGVRRPFRGDSPFTWPERPDGQVPAGGA